MVSFDLQEYRSIYGNVLRAKPIGFCSFGHHLGYLTEDELNNRNCINKCCNYLIRNTKHEFWKKYEYLYKKPNFIEKIRLKLSKLSNFFSIVK